MRDRASVSAHSAAAIELVNEPQPKSSADWNVLYDYLSRAYAIVHAPGRKYAVTSVLSLECRAHAAASTTRSGALATGPSSCPSPRPSRTACASTAHRRDRSRFSLTAHPYLLFDRGAVSLSDERKIEVICDMKSDLVASRKNYITHVAEWSPALSDCTRYLNGAPSPSWRTDRPGRGRGSRYDGTFDDQPAVGSCKGLTGDASKFSAAYKQRLGRYWNAQTRTYSNSDGWIAWTWKTEKGQAEEWRCAATLRLYGRPTLSRMPTNSLRAQLTQSSYQMGLRYGWIPKDASSYLYSDPC